LLLFPAGRTLEDIDFHSLADDGREVFGQVTYHPRGTAPVKKKLAALKAYGERGAHLVFFCRRTGFSQEDRVHFVSCDKEVMPWLDGDVGTTFGARASSPRNRRPGYNGLWCERAVSSSKLQGRVAARLLRTYEYTAVEIINLSPICRTFRLGDAGFEPATSAV
jgi:hypothetical protein